MIFLYYRKVAFMILFGFFLIKTGIATAQIVYSYEGFDYYSGANFAPGTTYDNRGTYLPVVSSVPIDLNGINNFPSRSKTNSPITLGWAGDWIASNGASSTGFYTVGTSPSSTVTSFDNKFSLVNSGFYAQGGQSSGVTIGRRLQTSTGGPYYRYTIPGTIPNNTLTHNSPTSTLPWSSYIATDPISTLTATPARTQVNHPSPTFNNLIGADGTTIWFSFLMNKINNNNEECFIALHRNTNPYDILGSNTLSVGYFNDPLLSFGANRYWGMKVNGTVIPPISTANPNSKIEIGKFDLLVVGLTFNHTGSNRLQLYVIHDVDKTGTNPVYGVNYNNYNGGVLADGSPASITSDADALVAGDLAFHSVAYFGGASINQSAVDEIRFGDNFQSAALSSASVSLIKGLCTGLNGDNIYSEGDFANALSVDNNGAFTVLDPSEIKGGTSQPAGIWADQTDRSGNSPYPVIFKKGSANLNGSPYQNIAPGFVYVPDNQDNPDETPVGAISSQPDDGGFAIATQTRNPFGKYAGSIPAWIKTFDNSGAKFDALGTQIGVANGNGLLMMVNASYQPGIFYERQVGGICSGTQYEFFLDVINVFSSSLASISNPSGVNLDTSPTGGVCGNSYCSPSCDPANEPGCQQMSWPGRDQAGYSGIGAATNGSLDLGTNVGVRYNLSPELEFLIDGITVYVPPTPIPNDEGWHRVGFTFVTKNISGNNIKLTIRNRARGGNGNDLAIDNITFRPCGPSTENRPSFIDCGTKSLQVKVIQAGAGYDPASYRWQYQDPASTTWNDFPGAALGGNAFVTQSPIDFLDLTDPLIRAKLQQNGFVRAIIAGDEASTAQPKCSVFSVPVLVGCTLPVSWISFKGTLLQEGTKLDWITGFENNVEGFEVQRAADGNQYTTIGKVTPRGKSGQDTQNNYTFWDRSPLPGINYYRILETSRNGTGDYSKTITVFVEKNFISVYPNPADNLLTISLGTIKHEENVNVSFISLLGNTVKVTENKIAPDQTTWQIPVNDLPTGIYFVEIHTSVQTFIRKIVVVR